MFPGNTAWPAPQPEVWSWLSELLLLPFVFFLNCAARWLSVFLTERWHVWSNVPWPGTFSFVEMCSGFIRWEALNKTWMKFNSTRGAQSKIPAMGRLPGVLVSQQDLSITQTYLHAKNEVIAHFTERLVYAWHKKISGWLAQLDTECEFVYVGVVENHFHKVSGRTKTTLANHGHASFAGWAFYEFSSGLLGILTAILPLLVEWNTIQKLYFQAET